MTVGFTTSAAPAERPATAASRGRRARAAAASEATESAVANMSGCDVPSHVKKPK
jgi:hypothetical protein